MMRPFLMLCTALGWFALAAQFYLFILNRVTSLAEAIMRYFTFFTILTNLLVVLCFTVLLLGTPTKWREFFSRSTVLTAITVYITIVGLVYNLVLRPLWNPEGLQKIVDELLHSVIPVLVVVYWLIVAKKNMLRWDDLWLWLLYPLVYLIVILIRGTLSGFYPYPFVDVNKLGYPAVALNCLWVCLAFLFFSLLFIGISKIKTRTRSIKK